MVIKKLGEEGCDALLPLVTPKVFPSSPLSLSPPSSFPNEYINKGTSGTINRNTSNFMIPPGPASTVRLYTPSYEA